MSLPFPADVVPNYVDPPDHRSQTIVLHTICLTLVTGATAIRTYTRLRITKSFGSDDYMAVFAWAASVSWSAVLIKSENYGIGRHLWDIPPNWLVTGLKYLFVSEIMYIPIVLAVKLSFLLCFNRIFTGKAKWFIWFGIISNLIFYTVVFFDTLFLCKPIALSWNPSLTGKCGSEEALPYATGIWGFLGDFYIFVLPIPNVWSLNMKTPKKLKLLATFGVGLFTCIASIIRFVFTLQLVDDVDATWNYITLSLWAVLEINIGIICSCFLSFPAFFKHYESSKLYSYIHRLTSRVTQSRSTRDNNGGAPLQLRGDMAPGSWQYYRAKIARSGSREGEHDLEALPLTDQKTVNVKRTVELESHPIKGYMGNNVNGFNS